MLYNYEVTVYGEALEDFGLSVSGAIDGIGALSFGFLWECPAIWSVYPDEPSTSWSSSGPAPSTTWDLVNDEPPTTWVPVDDGTFGEC